MEILPLCWECITRAVVLLSIANGSPVIARKIFNHRFAQPIDIDRVGADRHPLFGRSKTWRGLCASIIMTSLAAPLANLTLQTGALFGLLAMVADLCSSFIKRRLGYEESSKHRFIDIIPEALLPVAVLHDRLQLSVSGVIVAALLFFLLEAVFSPFLYKLHIRKRPY